MVEQLSQEWCPVPLDHRVHGKTGAGDVEGEGTGTGWNLRRVDGAYHRGTVIRHHRSSGCNKEEKTGTKGVREVPGRRAWDPASPLGIIDFAIFPWNCASYTGERGSMDGGELDLPTG